MKNENDNSWNNEINSKLTIVTPPSLFVPRSGIKIFLGGSIDLGNAPDWNKNVIKFIEKFWTEINITLYNPRRPGEFNPDDEVEQAAWSISMLNIADYILLYLTGDGASPISTLELGMFIKDPRLFLSINEEYSRKEIIEYHYNCFGIGQIYETPNDCITAMKSDWFRKDVK